MQYTVKYTDISTSPIVVDESDIDSTSTDLSIIGRIEAEYGDKLNENFLHLLENFACPEDLNNIGNPDLTQVIDNKLSNPTEGEIWYNSTQNRPFVWNGLFWNALSKSTDVTANFGKIYHGENLPLPVSADGYEFSYAECIYSVSPAIVDNNFNFLNCAVDENGVVDCRYRETGGLEVHSVANYIIVAIKGNNNKGLFIPPVQYP